MHKVKDIKMWTYNLHCGTHFPLSGQVSQSSGHIRVSIVSVGTASSQTSLGGTTIIVVVVDVVSVVVLVVVVNVVVLIVVVFVVLSGGPGVVV